MSLSVNPLCHLLEDYLVRDLTGEERARFSSHLSQCAVCRQAVSEHQRLEAILTEASVRLELVPAGLAERIERRIRLARRRRIAVLSGGLAAALAVIWLLAGNRHSSEQRRDVVAEVRPEPPAPPAPPAIPQVRVTFPVSANIVAVAAKTDCPDVTFLWVYPGMRDPPRAEPAADDLPSPLERNQP